MTNFDYDSAGAPPIADRTAFETELAAIRLREKAHTREADAIAAARRRLPMVAVDGATPLIGPNGTTTLLEAFEGRPMLLAYYLMWYAGKPAAGQCEGCTWVTSHMHELSYIHSRDVSFATIAQGPFDETFAYRNFMGWEMPWYAAAQASLETLLAGRKIGMMHLVAYLRRGTEVFETYWTTRRGVEVMDNSFHLLDLTIYGRQENWEDSPQGWPQRFDGKDRMRRNGRPIAQWTRIERGRSDPL